jgi:DNA mismatch repair protein MutS2
MIYPSNFEKKITFDTVRDMIKDFCLSSLGESQVVQMQFETSYCNICKLQEETEEFRQILLFEPHFPAQDYYDLTSELQRLKREGTFIDVENLCNLRASLQTIYDCLYFFRTRKETEKYPRLTAISENLSFDNTLIGKIHLLVDDKGNVKSSASEELYSIRKQIQHLELEISKSIKKILLQSKQTHLIDEAADITIRNGRFVLPVPAVNKRKIKGIVQDESSSGQTFFIEPQEIFELNNSLHNLSMDERREIVRILTQFTNYIRPSIDSILEAFGYLSSIDFIRAKAKFALHIHACKPIISNQTCLQWKKAVHPLLYLSYKAQNKPIVPLDIELGNKFKILIISGPNAGGKSVCLKTLALLQYMFQCGLLVSVSEISEFGIFEDIFIDIGDEQSIDNDLSTYSSHLKNMQVMIENAHAKSLFLIDELGGGTDPQYGAAMAESLLEFLSAKNACGLVTTHFGNLKLLSEKDVNIENGAMLFDEKEMRPLFLLKTGQFGTSFTFEIAEKTGLNKDIIQKAIQKVGKVQIRYEKLLQKLEQKQLELDKRQKMMEFTDTQLLELKQGYVAKNTELNQKRSEIIKQARNEAKMLIQNANKLIEKAIREIKESHADKEVIKELRQEIQHFAEEIETEEKNERPIPDQQPVEIEIESVQLYDTVIIGDTSTVGEVTSIDGENITVSFNSVNLRTTVDKVQKVSHAQQKQLLKSTYKDVYSSLNLNNKAEDFKLQLDIRGMRANDAMSMVEQYLDDAMLLSIHNVRILHGKGNGILRMVVREYLSKNKQVKAFYDERVELGGHGITVIELQRFTQ